MCRATPISHATLTVAAGVCGVSYRTFVLSVAVSTALWVGVFLYIGVTYGGRMEHLLRVHRETYVILPAAIILGLLIYLARRLVKSRPKTPG